MGCREGAVNGSEAMEYPSNGSAIPMTCGGKENCGVASVEDMEGPETDEYIDGPPGCIGGAWAEEFIG